MRLALIPLRTLPRQWEANFKEVQRRLEEALRHHPHLVCFPECTLTGYLYEEQDVQRFAEPIPGPTTERMAVLARRSGVSLAFGMLEATPAGVYDSALLVDANGHILLHHRKIEEQPPFQCGRAVSSARTPFGHLALLICGDLFNPEVIAQLPSNLDLLLVPMARSFDGRSPDPQRWLGEERAAYLQAAQASGVTTALVNALEVEGEERSFGGALVVGPQGEVLAEAPHGSDSLLVWEGL